MDDAFAQMFGTDPGGFPSSSAFDMVLECNCHEDSLKKLEAVHPRFLARRLQALWLRFKECLPAGAAHNYYQPQYEHPDFQGLRAHAIIQQESDALESLTLRFPAFSGKEFKLWSAQNLASAIPMPTPPAVFAASTGDFMNPIDWGTWAAHVRVKAVRRPLAEGEAAAAAKDEGVVADVVTFLAPLPPPATAAGQATRVTGLVLRGTGVLEDQLAPLQRLCGIDGRTLAQNVARLLRHPVAEFSYAQTLFEITVQTQGLEAGGITLRTADSTPMSEVQAEQIEAEGEVHLDSTEADTQSTLPAAAYRLVLELFGSSKKLPMLQRSVVVEMLQQLSDERGVLIDNAAASTTLKTQVLSSYTIPRNDPLHTVQRGAVLHGPPGTAKSTIARCVFEKAGMRHLDEIRSASSFANKYIGETEAQLTKIFQPAEEHPDVGHIMVIEEVEALAERRSSGPDAHHAKWLSHLFSLIDRTSNVLLLCTTNRYEALDTAFTRVGRVSVAIFCGKLNVTQATRLLAATLQKLSFTSVTYDSLASLDVTKQLRNFSGAQIRGVAEGVARALHEKNQSSLGNSHRPPAMNTAKDIEVDLVDAVNRVIASSNDPDLFSAAAAVPAEIVDGTERSHTKTLCQRASLTGRVLHHCDHLWFEVVGGGTRTVHLKAAVNGPSSAYSLAAAIGEEFEAKTVTIIDARRKEFLRHEEPPTDATVECSGNAQAGGTVVVVDVDDLVGIVVDQSTQHGISKQAADGMTQEATSQSLHVAREHAFQNVLAFSRRLAQRVRPSSDTFCLCVLSTAHPYVLHRLDRAMSFALPEAPFNPALVHQAGYTVSPNPFGTSTVIRSDSKAAGLLPLTARVSSTKSQAILMELTINKIQDKSACEIGFVSANSPQSGTLAKEGSSAMLILAPDGKEWTFSVNGMAPKSVKDLGGRPTGKLSLAMVLAGRTVAVYSIDPAIDNPVLLELQSLSFKVPMHPFVSLMTPLDSISSKIFVGTASFPRKYDRYHDVRVARSLTMTTFVPQAWFSFKATGPGAAEIGRTAFEGASYLGMRFPGFICPPLGSLKVAFRCAPAAGGDCLVGFVPSAANPFPAMPTSTFPNCLTAGTYLWSIHGRHLYCRKEGSTANRGGNTSKWLRNGAEYATTSGSYVMSLNRRRREICLHWQDTGSDGEELVLHVPDEDYEPCIVLGKQQDNVRIVSMEVSREASPEPPKGIQMAESFRGDSYQFTTGSHPEPWLSAEHKLGETWQQLRFPGIQFRLSRGIFIEFQARDARPAKECFLCFIPAVFPCQWGESLPGSNCYHKSELVYAFGPNDRTLRTKAAVQKEVVPALTPEERASGRRYRLLLSGSFLWLSWGDEHSGIRRFRLPMSDSDETWYQPSVVTFGQGSGFDVFQIDTGRDSFQQKQEEMKHRWREMCKTLPPQPPPELLALSERMFQGQHHPLRVHSGGSCASLYGTYLPMLRGLYKELELYLGSKFDHVPRNPDVELQVPGPQTPSSPTPSGPAMAFNGTLISKPPPPRALLALSNKIFEAKKSQSHAHGGGPNTPSPGVDCCVGYFAGVVKPLQSIYADLETYLGTHFDHLPRSAAASIPDGAGDLRHRPGGLQHPPSRRAHFVGDRDSGSDEILHGDSIWLRAHTGMYIGDLDLDATNDFDFPIWVKARGRSKDQKNELRIEKAEDMEVPVESGDVVRLVVIQTGVHMDCVESAVRARWYDDGQGQWQRIAIVKKEGGVIRSGDTVFLRGWQGAYIDAQPGTEDGDIKCRWHDEGEWQAFTIDKYPD